MTTKDIKAWVLSNSYLKSLLGKQDVDKFIKANYDYLVAFIHRKMYGK